MRMLATGFCLLSVGGSGGSDIGGAFGDTWSEGGGGASGAGGVGEGVEGAGAPLAAVGVEGGRLTGLPRIIVLSLF